MSYIYHANLGDCVEVACKSNISGKINIKEINMPYVEYIKALHSWRSGKLIQEAFPNLSPSEREFIMTGITDDDEWNKLS